MYPLRFNNISEFNSYIGEDEAYDEHGVFHEEMIRKSMELGTLIGVASISDDIYYNPLDKSFFKIIGKVANHFNVDTKLLKKNNSKYYKSVPQKYWGLVLKCLRYTYSCELDDEEHNPSYLYYLSVKTRYNSVDEFEEQAMIKNLVDSLEEYIHNCVCEKKQFLFEYRDDGSIQKKYAPFKCMRYVENEYLCNNLEKVENVELCNIISERFDNISDFKAYIDNPGNFETLAEDDSFIKLWNEYVAKSKKNSDYPKSYDYPEYFCEQEVKILLEGITHSNGLKNFYHAVKNDYTVTLDKLQAIVDMNYAVNMYPEDDERNYSYTQCREISQFIQEKYDEIVERFIPFLKNKLDKADSETDDLQKFQATFTKWIVLNALSENKELCDKLNEVGINIQYKRTSHTKKPKKA